MSTRTLPQRYCDQLTDHPAHPVTYGRNQLPLYRCPGRFTPSAHRTGPVPEIATADDPFAGIPFAHADEE
jgi:hypothetical protein